MSFGVSQGVHLPDCRVYRGRHLLGTLTRTGSDMPWHQGTFEPAFGFAKVKSLFDRERELLEADRIDEWRAVWDEIARPGLVLEPLDGCQPIAEFLLHIDGQQAWWCY